MAVDAGTNQRLSLPSTAADIRSGERPRDASYALSLAIGCTGLPLLGAAASAQDIEFSFGRDGPRMRTVDRCNPNFEECYARQGYMDRPVSVAARRARTEQGRSMGIYRARIVSSDRRTIEVRGRTPDGDRTYITFARGPAALCSTTNALRLGPVPVRTTSRR